MPRVRLAAMKTPPTSTSGIFLSDAFLAMEDLSLVEKVFYQLIQRQPEPACKHPVAPLSHSRLAKLAGVSPSTSQRTLRKLKELGPVPAATTGSGIFLNDAFLAAADLSLKAKIIFLLIVRYLNAERKHFTSRLTDPRLALMSGFSEKTVWLKIQELEKRHYIGIANRVAKGKTGSIRAVRDIYLDRRLAGYRRRAINKAKKPMEAAYRYFVLELGMSSAAYVAMVKDKRRSEWATTQKEKRKWAQKFEEAELAEKLAALSDADVASRELADGVPTGSYAKRKQAHLEREATRQAGFDSLFGDVPGIEPGIEPKAP